MDEILKILDSENLDKEVLKEKIKSFQKKYDDLNKEKNNLSSEKEKIKTEFEKNKTDLNDKINKIYDSLNQNEKNDDSKTLDEFLKDETDIFENEEKGEN